MPTPAEQLVTDLKQHNQPDLLLQFLNQRLIDLLSVQYQGESEIRTRTVDAEEMVVFRDPKSLALAIADCERRIRQLQGGKNKTVLFSTSKGL